MLTILITCTVCAIAIKDTFLYDFNLGVDIRVNSFHYKISIENTMSSESVTSVPD